MSFIHRTKCDTSNTAGRTTTSSSRNGTVGERGKSTFSTDTMSVYHSESFKVSDRSVSSTIDISESIDGDDDDDDHHHESHCHANNTTRSSWINRNAKQPSSQQQQFLGTTQTSIDTMPCSTTHSNMSVDDHTNENDDIFRKKSNHHHPSEWESERNPNNNTIVAAPQIPIRPINTERNDEIEMMIQTTEIRPARHSSERNVSSSFDAIPRRWIEQDRLPSISHYRHNNEMGGEEDYDDDDDRWNHLLDHDKDYIDLIPSKDQQSQSQQQQHPSARTTTAAADLPPKLRSFSEPEVRDDPFSIWYHQKDVSITTITDPTMIETERRLATNVLRHRCNSNIIQQNQHETLDQSDGGHHRMIPSRCVGVAARGRAYTADPYVSTSKIPAASPSVRQRTFTAAAASYNNNNNVFINQDNPHKYSIVPRAFHSSWDNDDAVLASSFHSQKECLRPTSHDTRNQVPIDPSHRNMVTSTNTATTTDDSMRISSSSSSSLASMNGRDLILQDSPRFLQISSLPSPIMVQQQHQQHQIDRTIIHPASHAITTTSHTRNEIEDQERVARLRWIRINRRFQLIVAVVVLIFSFLLFAILVCWIVLASTFILSWDKQCDVPLKPYFWLASVQLLLDVFRSDIIRIVLRWNQNTNASTPGRVIVLHLGISSVFTSDELPQCSTTAPEFFHASAAFVSLSLAAWITIVFGYAVPFCVVAVLLTMNGYNPNTSNINSGGSSTTPTFPFISCGSTTLGAPPGCVDKLCTIDLRNLSGTSYPKECCICMEHFNDQDIIVTTKCQHIFHKNCCREWLRQARTCPVCRDDIPSSLEVAATSYQQPENEDTVRPTSDPLNRNHVEHQPPPHIPATLREPTSRPVANLLRAMFDARNELTEYHTTATVTPIHQNHNVSTSNRRATAVSIPSLSPGGAIDIERGL
jgi:Ring finger domain